MLMTGATQDTKKRVWLRSPRLLGAGSAPVNRPRGRGREDCAGQNRVWLRWRKLVRAGSGATTDAGEGGWKRVFRAPRSFVSSVVRT